MKSWDKDLAQTLQHLPKYSMDSGTKSHMLERLRLLEQGASVQKKWPRRFLNLAVASAALILVSILILGYKANLNKTYVHRPNAEKQHTYNYKKVLGFDPKLPINIPSDFRLKSTAIEIYTGAPNGDSKVFTADYQNAKGSHITIAETNSTKSTAVQTDSQYHVTADGLKITELADGSLAYFKNGVMYNVSAESPTFAARLEDEQSYLLHLTGSVKTPPLQITETVAGLKNMTKSLSFKPVIPTSIPPGYHRNLMNAVINKENGNTTERAELMYTQGNGPNIITIVETPGKSNARHDSDETSSLLTVDGYRLTVINNKTNPELHGIVWFDEHTNVTYSISAPLPVNVLVSILSSMFH